MIPYFCIDLQFSKDFHIRCLVWSSQQSCKLVCKLVGAGVIILFLQEKELKLGETKRGDSSQS